MLKDSSEENKETSVEKKKGGIASLLGESFDPWAALGGVRGLAETTLPGVVFLVVYLITSELVPSVVAPLAVAVALLVLRIIQGIDITPALGGIFGIAISAAWAWRSGQSSNYFAVGLLTNAGYFAGLIISLIVRWPAMGVIIGFLRGDAFSWRKDPTQILTRRRYIAITWLWALLFGIRLLVQVPLYFAQATAALAAVKLVMGTPLFALVGWVTWMLVRNLPPVSPQETSTEETTPV